MVYYIFLIASVLFALLAARSRDLLFSVIYLSVLSVSVALLFFLLQAPDIAITEAAVNAGIAALIYVTAIKKTRRQE